MTKEFELRAKVKNLKEIKKTLKELGLKSPGELLVEDYAFDTKEDYFYKRGVMIRMRSIDGQKHLFAYKGPCEDSSYKVRREIEIEISDPDKLAKILKNIGLNITFEMEKIRETYYIDGGKIELDCYPFLGCFIEIEAPPENIEKIIKKLNISREKFNNRSLDYYIDKKRKELGFDFKIKFDAEKEFLSNKRGNDTKIIRK